ncbi:uncharacterized protein EV420DRAFT_1529631 [Desarmillaria tabescens]|uniref:Uncharacterized protein n=1 Tax=Armillaria tabescens TaxID=1929756 RepID=A0AA39N8K2_ARMTA|nr:uncharacterized protein EV420DRAFT_1529631 [Desarmillaria tabescens]KAK0460998.1 hypothetical protein EV420DRAFT_1529631 [Desarmillaria tabescens]
MAQPLPSIDAVLSTLPFRNVYSTGLFYSSPKSTTSDESHPHDSVHPYPVIEARKRRKAWSHVFEKAIFTSEEISNESAPRRRKVYVSSLEAHIDALHDQLLQMGLWPVSTKELERHKGLNSKTAKSMVAMYHHKVVLMQIKISQYEKMNQHHAQQNLALRESH